MTAFAGWGRGCHSGDFYPLVSCRPPGSCVALPPAVGRGNCRAVVAEWEWSEAELIPCGLVSQIYRRCWLVFRKSSSKGPQRLEKYPDEKSVCLRGCPKVRGAGPESTLLGVAELWGGRGRCPAWLSPLWILSQVTEISNVKCVTRLPKETKRQAVAIIFTDDSARTFTCDSGGVASSLWSSRLARQGGGRAG
jgi:hypothetical protein